MQKIGIFLALVFGGALARAETYQNSPDEFSKILMDIFDSNYHDCVCVPYYQCTNVTNDIKIQPIDLRFEPGEETRKEPRFEGGCNDALKYCCNKNMLKPISPLPVPNLHSGIACGTRHGNGIHFHVSDNKKNEAQFGEFPWHIAVLRIIPRPNGDVLGYECGGSLIEPSVVLTVAHCIKKVNEPMLDVQFLRVRAGEWNAESTAEPYPHADRAIRKIVIHPDYQWNGAVNDVALLFLTQPFDLAPHINTICLPNPGDVFDHSRCVATGWGKDKWGGYFQVILKRVEVPIVPYETCVQKLRKTRLGPNYQLSRTFICAGGEGRDMCTGDGGSPLVCQIPNGRYVQSGIVSWGIGCNDATPGVYVNAAMFRNWIDDQILSNHIPQPFI